MTEGYEAPPITTVGELRAALAHVPDETKVMATWEGIYRLLAPMGLVRSYEYGEALVFDVEYHWPARR